MINTVGIVTLIVFTTSNIYNTLQFAKQNHLNVYKDIDF